MVTLGELVPGGDANDTANHNNENPASAEEPNQQATHKARDNNSTKPNIRKNGETRIQMNINIQENT